MIFSRIWRFWKIWRQRKGPAKSRPTSSKAFRGGSILAFGRSPMKGKSVLDSRRLHLTQFSINFRTNFLQLGIQKRIIIWAIVWLVPHGVSAGEKSKQLGVRGDCLEELVFKICFLRATLHVTVFLQHKEYHYRERDLIYISYS